MELLFKNRKEAGKLLSLKLHALIGKERQNIIMLALPRGGVPVAAEIAKTESLQFDVLIVRKIGHPDNREFGVGAIAEDGTYWINPFYENASEESTRKINLIMNAETIEIRRRMKMYRGSEAMPVMKDKIVILVDDGLATGVTARVSAMMAMNQGAQKVILAIPVASTRTVHELNLLGIDVISLHTTNDFLAVGYFYKNFAQVEDAEVISMLKNSKKWFNNARELR